MLLLSETGTGAMSETVTPVSGGTARNIQLHLDAVGGVNENFVATINNCVAVSQDMVAATDVIDVRHMIIFPGQTATFTYANTAANTWTLRVACQQGLATS